MATVQFLSSPVLCVFRSDQTKDTRNTDYYLSVRIFHLPNFINFGVGRISGSE
jgi:hypothetical protein